MISRITGVIESVETGRVTLSLAHAAFCVEVQVPASLSQSLLGREGESLTLHTRALLEGASQGTSLTPRLLGFASPGDLRFFELFTTVKGVGPRRALRALAIPTERVARAIAERDTTALKALPEIGARTAETIVAELRGKVDAFVDVTETIEAKPEAGTRAAAEASKQATEALVRLGETRAEAERLVARALERDPSLESADAVLAAAFAMRG
jgi:Holliday junction DNA helicase RuvA